MHINTNSSQIQYLRFIKKIIFNSLYGIPVCKKKFGFEVTSIYYVFHYFCKTKQYRSFEIVKLLFTKPTRNCSLLTSRRKVCHLD